MDKYVTAAFLVEGMGGLEAPIFPDRGTFFADGQSLSCLLARWFQP